MTLKKLNQEDLKEQIETINNEGIFLIEDFLDPVSLAEIKEEVLDYHSKIGNPYNFGSVYGLNNTPNVQSLKQIQVFKKKWIKDLFLAMNQSEKGFYTSLYSTHDYKINDELGRNGYLHFDRNRSLKFFLYLNNVTKQNAAFYVQLKSNLIGRKLRKAAWKNMCPQPADNFFLKAIKKIFGPKYNKVKNRIELDYPNFFDSTKLKPVEAKGGTLIVFDSDLFHKGGQIRKEGMERLVIRMHSYLS